MPTDLRCERCGLQPYRHERGGGFTKWAAGRGRHRWRRGGIKQIVKGEGMVTICVAYKPSQRATFVLGSRHPNERRR